MSAQILVVKPRSLTAADKKLLRDAGVVCIEATDPHSVRLIQPEGSVLSGDELFYAAMKALAADGYSSNTHPVFVRTIAKLCEQHVTGPQKP